MSSSMARYWDGAPPTRATINRASLRLSPKIQVRSFPQIGSSPIVHHGPTVDEYAQLIREERERAAAEGREPEDMGPLGVMLTPDGRQLLFDGFHRVEAYERLRIAEVPCEVYEGTEADAVIMACLVNGGRGLTYTPGDQARVAQRYIEALLEKYPGEPLPTNAHIARTLRMAASTVRLAIERLARQHDIPPERVALRTGADGVQRPVLMPPQRPRATTAVTPPDPPAHVAPGADALLDRDDALASRGVPLIQLPDRGRGSVSRADLRATGSYGQAPARGLDLPPDPIDALREQRLRAVGDARDYAPELLPPDELQAAPGGETVRGLMVMWTTVSDAGVSEQRTMPASLVPDAVRRALLAEWEIYLVDEEEAEPGR